MVFDPNARTIIVGGRKRQVLTLADTLARRELQQAVGAAEPQPARRRRPSGPYAGLGACRANHQRVSGL